MPSDKVVIEIDGKALIAAPDGPVFIRERAIQEIRLTKRYDEEEMKFVEKDSTFTASCENAYLKVRDACSGREWHEAKVTDKGKTPSHAPYRWSVAIHYERPGTRGMFNRLMKE
jgi:hypothetical protein